MTVATSSDQRKTGMAGDTGRLGVGVVAQYEDVQAHLRSLQQWTYQLNEKLLTTSSAQDRRRIQQAIYILPLLRRQCSAFQDLLATREVNHIRSLPPLAQRPQEPSSADPQVLHLTSETNNGFVPVPTQLQARPSVYTQLHQPIPKSHSPHCRNYYSSLFVPSDDTLTATPTSRRSFTMETTPTTFHRNSLDDIIKEFTDKDLPRELHRSSVSDKGKSFKLRLSLRMGQFSDQATSKDKLEAALTLLKAQDSTICILPFRKEDMTNLPPLYQASDLPAEINQLHKYFRFKMNASAPSSFLNGQIHVASALSADDLLDQLKPRQYKGRFELSKLQCQLEETSIIGFLLRSSDLINRKDLTSGILQHPSWNSSAGFEFVLSRQSLHAGADSAMCLAVEATATKAKEASAFFEALYDGVNTALPHGVELLYVPVLQGGLSEEDRAAFVKAQRSFIEAERAVTIAGFKDLEDPVLMANGITTVTIRHLLLSIPLASKPDTKFFHGVDRQPTANSEFLIARISGDFSEQEVARTMEQLDLTIRKLVHPSDHQAVFTTLGEGLRYGGFCAQYGRRRRPASVVSPKRREYIQSIRTKVFSTSAASPPPASAWSRPTVSPSPTLTPTANPTPRESIYEAENLSSFRREMVEMKQDIDSFKTEMNQNIDNVHAAMNRGFEDMKSILDELLGTRPAPRNVRARMEVDEDPQY